jgi:tyrosine-protein kinase Etk/Wzc
LDTHPEIVQLNKQLETAKANLNLEVQKLLAVKVGSSDPLAYRGRITEQIASALVELNVADSKVVALQSSVEEYNSQMSLLPDKEVELARLERNYRINEKIHTMLVEKYEDSKIAVQARLANIRLLEESSIPSVPIKPNKKMNYLVGLVIGLALGVSLSLTFNALDTKIHTLDDMERFVDLPVFGTIPFIKVTEGDQAELSERVKVAQGKEKDELEEAQMFVGSRLISHYAPKSPMAESYRTLRTNVIARKPADQSVVICITSSAPKEGKTTTIANLAITLAQTDAKTVLIDLDLRRPMIAKIFNADKNMGMSDYLIDSNLSIDKILKTTAIPNLDIITSGYIPPNPSEILASTRMDVVLNELRKKYDYILLDAPPVIAVTDALILAKKADMMLLVVKIGQTEKDIAKRTKELMSNVGATIAGAIANGIEARKYYRGYSYYYYYYSYYYYYDDAKSDGQPKKRDIRRFLRKN